MLLQPRHTFGEKVKGGSQKDSIEDLSPKDSPKDSTSNLSRLSPEAQLFSSEVASELYANLMHCELVIPVRCCRPFHETDAGVSAYFVMSYIPLPLVAWEEIQRDFDAAGRRPQQLPPMVEVRNFSMRFCCYI